MPDGPLQDRGRVGGLLQESLAGDPRVTLEGILRRQVWRRPVPVGRRQGVQTGLRPTA